MKERTDNLVKSIKEVLLNKNTSYDEKIHVKRRINDLIALTDSKDAEAYVFLGKINVLLENIDEAIANFNTSIIINSSLALAHYELFKIYVTRTNYEEALQQIKLYEMKSRINCDIYINLLNRYLYNRRDYINQSTSILGINNIPKSILLNYNLMIDSINRQDYIKALKHVSVCIKLIKKRKYDIDLTILQQILTNVKDMYYENEKKNKIKELEECYYNSNNYGMDHYILMKLFKLDPNNINTIILLIENSILLVDYDTAEQFLKLVETKITISNKRLDYLKLKIKSLKSPMYIGSTKNIDLQKLFETTNNIRIIEEESIKGNVEASINYGLNLFEKTTNSDYLYIVAKIMYNNGLYQDSLKLFKDYISIGNIYLKQAYYYLFFINKLLNNEEEASYYASLVYDLSSFIGIDIDLNDYEKNIFCYVDNFSDYSIIEIEKNILYDNLNSNIKSKIYK